jgi:hypothetical protein
MATFNWELVNAKSMDNYPYKNEDGTTTFMNGVVTSAVLRVTASNETESVVYPYYVVNLDAPVPDVFAPLDSIEKQMVLDWALDKINGNIKENLEASLEKRLSENKPVFTTIFSEEL